MKQFVKHCRVLIGRAFRQGGRAIISPVAQLRSNHALDSLETPPPFASGASGPQIGLADDQPRGVANGPARQLQDELQHRLGQDVADNGLAKWSPRASLLFILGSRGIFWGLAYLT